MSTHNQTNTASPAVHQTDSLPGLNLETNKMSSGNPFTDDNVDDTHTESHMGDQDDSDDSSSFISETSTIEYEQESYATYQYKAIQLMLDLFPALRAEEVTVERMEGGGYNRVISVTICESKPKIPWYSFRSCLKVLQPCLTGRPPKRRSNRPKKYILRIPRSPTQDMHHQVTILKYLAHKIPHPVPKVVMLDSSADNALGQAYMLQERLPGQPLSELWKTLNHAQRNSVARSIGGIILNLAKVKNQCPGIISIGNTTYDLTRDLIHVEPLPIPRSPPMNTASPADASIPSLDTPQTTQDFLLDLCARQRAHAVATSLPAFDKIWTRIIAMITTLHTLNFLPDTESFHLHHGDFHSRNILASIVDEHTVNITGILDWDLALFGPKFLTTSPPFFLWAGEDMDDEDERFAADQPEDAGLAEVKRAFEEIVGAEFCKGAYGREIVLLRRLWRVLLRGLVSGGDVFVVEEILDEFEGLCLGT